MKNQKSFTLGVFTILLFASLQGAVLGQTASQSTEAKVANIRAEGMRVRFDAAIPYSNATLTISAPDGTVYRREFGRGTVPSMLLFDKTGATLGNGQYTYELRFTTLQMRDLKQRSAAAPDEGVMDENGRTRRGRLSVQSVVQSGSFAVQNGTLYVGNEKEPTSRRISSTNSPQRQRSMGILSGNTLNRLSNHRFSLGAVPDQVIPDDLIVQGSACVGLDCVNNENFGFDTIRLKENNTRIQFDDTSTAAGFPTNNWQIRANSSASGGASFLAFVDQGASGNSETGTILFEVDAGAPANSLKVSSNGKVGFRTATPVLDLHVTTSDTPANRYEQTNAGGFTAQTWDIGANEANFFVRDVTGGSRLPFRIRPGAPTSSIDISASGNVGIATASPGTSLDVAGNIINVGSESGTTARGNNTTKLARVSMPPFASASLPFALVGGATTSTANIAAFGGEVGGQAAATQVDFVTGATTNTDTGTVRMSINSAGNVGIGTTTPDQKLSVNGDADKTGGNTWLAFSDERLKNIKGRFNTGLKAVMQLQPIRYEYLKINALGLKPDGEHIGFGAQAVQKIIPEAVTKNSAGYLMVNGDPILWTMLNAIKEQQKEIVALKGQIRQLQSASHRSGNRSRR